MKFGEKFNNFYTVLTLTMRPDAIACINLSVKLFIITVYNEKYKSNEVSASNYEPAHRLCFIFRRRFDFVLVFVSPFEMESKATIVVHTHTYFLFDDNDEEENEYGAFLFSPFICSKTTHAQLK